MSAVSAYLERLREQHPMPHWLASPGDLGPDALPTPFTVDAVVRGSVLREWRIMFDALARSDGGGITPRSFRGAAALEKLAQTGALGAIAARVDSMTVGACRDQFLAARDDRLLSSPPWADGVKLNVDSVRVADLVLVGAPTLLTGPLGSGKSTYCRWLANAQATMRLGGSSAPVPIFVDLRQVAPRLAKASYDGRIIPINDLLEAVLEAMGLPKSGAAELSHEWMTGSACLLVDGLDEIGVVLSQKAAGPIESAIVRTLNSLAPVHADMLVSSRPGVRAAEQLNEFLEVEFAPLTMAEATRMLQTSPGLSAAAPDRVAELVAAIPEQLRTRPLFLSLVGRLMTDNSLPDDLTRWTLLDASLRELLSVRLADKAQLATVEEFLGCGYESVVSALMEAASEAQLASATEGGALLIDQGRLMGLLYQRDPDTHVSRVIDVLTREAGLMVRRDTMLEFTHRIFQDLLTAEHLASQTDGDRDHVALLAALRQAPYMVRDTAELYVDRLSSASRVNDILDMCNAAIEEADSSSHSPYGGLCVWLAAIGLHEVVRAGHRMSRRDQVVVDSFVSCAADYVGDTRILGVGDRALIAEQLGMWGDRREGVGLDRDGVPEHLWVEVDGSETIVGIDESRRQSLLEGGVGNLAREVPAAAVSIRGFSISAYPTTWTQFRAFLTANNGYASAQWWDGWERDGSDWGTPARLAELIASRSLGNVPVVGVDWFEALGYCRWLSQQFDQFIDLPTEEEWEFAARGQSGRLYPWGESFNPALVNWAGSGLCRVVPVGCFAASRDFDDLRPYDMIGNVWEWTLSVAGVTSADGFAPIGQARSRGPSAKDTRRVVRGGCYLNEVPLLRSTYRGNDVATARFDRQGFRVVRRQHAPRGRGLA